MISPSLPLPVSLSFFLHASNVAWHLQRERTISETQERRTSRDVHFPIAWSFGFGFTTLKGTKVGLLENYKQKTHSRRAALCELPKEAKDEGRKEREREKT